MRLWHEALIPYLPNKQLLGQHRECCAMRGNFWGRKHRTVDYVWNYSPGVLFHYHMLVMNELERRGYTIDYRWYHITYRGKNCAPYPLNTIVEDFKFHSNPLYTEHNQQYLKECIENLRKKGIEGLDRDL